jgi:hypothetical protein
MHQHDHDHHHHHDSAEIRSQPVVLDLGDGIGALIVHTDPELLGVEVEISPDGADDERQHKEVLRRAIGSATVSVLVYDNLPEGRYTLWIGDIAWASGIRIESGSVAELDWRGIGSMSDPAPKEPPVFPPSGPRSRLQLDCLLSTDRAVAG